MTGYEMSLFDEAGRSGLGAGDGLSPAGAQQVAVALRQIGRLDVELAELRDQIIMFSRCRLVAAP